MNADFIFDIDGTLADNEHRQGYLRAQKKNWKAFKDEILNDTPYHDIVALLAILHKAGSRIILCSGREDGTERNHTITWLVKHDIWPLVAETPYGEKALYMRATGDYRDDSIVKWELFEQIQKDGFDPLMVFDDRDRVVNMWREKGIRCLQVQPGNF